MLIKRLTIALVFTVVVLTLIPTLACAAGGTISGVIQFPLNTTPTYNHNETLSVTSLAIYARNENPNSPYYHNVNVTTPGPLGNYSVHVPVDGLYSIYVFPYEVIDASGGPDHLVLVQYPDDGLTRPYLVQVNNGNLTADIFYSLPGHYAPPNNLTLATPTATPTAAPTSTTATPTPGFLPVAALGALGVSAALISRYRR